MFTRAEFEALIADMPEDWQAYLNVYPGLASCVYPAQDFSPPDSEQTVRITRAPSVAGESGLQFWISAEHQDDWRQREMYFYAYLAASPFLPISEDEFNALVAAQTQDLVTPLSLPLHPSAGYLGGLAMYTMAADLIVSVVAEYEDEFIHFLWETTA